MEQRSLRVVATDKNFFTKITSTITKLLVPTKVGLNGMMISVKRNSLLKAFDTYEKVVGKEDADKKEQAFRKYEDTFALYLESIDKYIMDSIYKKVKNGSASDFEKNALSNYYEVTHLKETEYMEYKYKKQKYLIDLDHETVNELEKAKLSERYDPFYSTKMETLYKGLLKHYSVQLADNLTDKNKAEIYDKIFHCLEEYITNILPIKMRYEKEEDYQDVVEEYNKFEHFTVGKLDQKEYIEKKMLLLGISRQLFTHSLPLIVAEQCYVKLLKDTRSLIVDTRVPQKRQMAYELLLDLIEEYNIRLLSTKIYWDKPALRDEYKAFWKAYREIQKQKEEDSEEYAKQREILFVKEDLKYLNRSKKDYSKMIQFAKEKLVSLGVMRQFANSYQSKGNYSKKKIEELVEEKEIG